MHANKWTCEQDNVDTQEADLRDVVKLSLDLSQRIFVLLGDGRRLGKGARDELLMFDCYNSLALQHMNDVTTSSTTILVIWT
jgi:hypothetical protein